MSYGGGGGETPLKLNTDRGEKNKKPSCAIQETDSSILQLKLRAMGNYVAPINKQKTQIPFIDHQGLFSAFQILKTSVRCRAEIGAEGGGDMNNGLKQKYPETHPLDRPKKLIHFYKSPETEGFQQISLVRGKRKTTFTQHKSSLSNSWTQDVAKAHEHKTRGASKEAPTRL